MRRDGKQDGEDQQAQHHHGSGQQASEIGQQNGSAPQDSCFCESPRVGVGSSAARYITPVKTFLAILVALLMFATLGVLFAGLFGLVRGGGDPARSNQLMRWRVILQGAALLLFALLMTLLRS